MRRHPEQRPGERFICNCYNIVRETVLSTLYLDGVRVGQNSYRDSGELIIGAVPVFARDVPEIAG
jgi:hypothetical protein